MFITILMLIVQDIYTSAILIIYTDKTVDSWTDSIVYSETYEVHCFEKQISQNIVCIEYGFALNNTMTTIHMSEMHPIKLRFLII